MRTSKLWFLLCLLPVLAAPPALSQAASASTDTSDEAKDGEAKDGEATDGEAKDGGGHAAKQATANPLVGPGAGASGEAPFPLKAFLSTTTSIGQGTFILQGQNNPMVATTISATPYIAWEGWWFMYSQSVSSELTPPNDGNQQWRPYLSDATLGARYWGLGLPELGMRFPITVRASLPFSLASRNSGQLTGLSATLSAQWITPFNMMFSGNLNAGYNVIVPAFARRSLTGADGKPYEDKYNNGELRTPEACLQRDPLEAANFSCGMIPRVANLSAGVSAIWFAHPQVMVNGSLGVSSAVAYYFSPDDEFTSPHARPGLGLTYATRSSFSVSYSPLRWLWLSAGVDTAQGLFQANGYDYRWFPLWDVISPYSNLSTVTLDATFIL